MPSIPLIVRIYLYLYGKIYEYPMWIRAIFAGFWLGILNRRQLQLIDRIYYEKTSNYCDEDYNKSGFLDWERKVFLKFFQSCQTILAAAFGGGREVIALHQIGFDVDGFECNRQLFEFAEKLFEQENVAGEFHLVPEDAVWHFGKIYDGAIIGWGAYMHIPGRWKRIDFLKKMRVQMCKDAPLIVSFFPRASGLSPAADENYLMRVYLTANFFRTILFREQIEFGDNLDMTRSHWFSEQEIDAEFAAAGFTLVYYSAQKYGHAVAIAS